MHWAEDPRVIFVRDFAYPRPPRRRLRTMTSAADIAHTPAHDYAEYVHIHTLPDATPSAGLFHCGGDNALPAEKWSRPALPYRIHSHRLRVQAHAKNERARLLSGPLVEIVVGVGDAKRQWSLHRNLLSYHSEYLASELQTNDATKNKIGNRLDLPEDDPKGFELLVKWLYQGKLDDVSDISSAESKYEYAVACHKLYMLCERFDMPQLKNMAIDQYRKGLNEARLVPDADEINDIYQKSPHDSPFRVLMTRIAARQIMDPDSDRPAESYRDCFAASPDFAIDLVNAIKSGSGGILFDDPTTGDNCTYHDHEHGPHCYGKGKGKAGADGAGTVRKARLLRPDSPPSPPRTPPPETTPFETPRTQARKPDQSPTKVCGFDTPNGVDGDDENNDGGSVRADGVKYDNDRDTGDASPQSTPAAAKPGGQPESAVESESPGGRSPKRHPPKLRRRGSTSARHPASPGNL